MSKPPVIAIVDDDAEVREALADLLHVEGLASCAFDSVEAFLAAYASRAWGAVITDVRMSGASGLDLLARLRRSEPRLPVLVVTSLSDSETRRRAIAAGASAVLPKPFRPAELLGELASALDAAGRDPES